MRGITTKGYNFIAHTADIAAEIRGDSLENLFLSATEAWMVSAMETHGIIPDHTLQMRLEDDTPEELLVNFINELNYLLFIKNSALCEINEIKITESEKKIEMSASLGFHIYTEGIGKILKKEIKAMTFHRLKIEKTGDIYKTLIVFDI